MYAYNDADKVLLLGADAELAVEENPAESEPSSAEATDGQGGSDDEIETSVKGKKQRITIQRYKGLGEMNPEELWETTMDPKTRHLKLVTVEDAADADRVFDILMGEDVSSRKSFIQGNAKLANLDI